MEKEIEKKLKYLDKIFFKISQLNNQLIILNELGYLNNSKNFNKFNITFKIIKLIENFKVSIKKEITKRIYENESYLFNYSKKNYIKDLKYNSTEITNNYKFKISYNDDFNYLKKEINSIIENIPKVVKIKIKNQISDYKKYCSDYRSQLINKYTISRMNKFKLYFKYL